MNDNLKVGIEINANDKASKALKNTVAEVKHLQNVTQKFEAIGKSSIVAGTALVGTLGLAAKTAVDFEKGMSNVSTLVDTNVESMKNMSDSVLDISKRTPVALNDLTSALYDVRSAGIPAADALGVLEKSAKLGVTGLGTTSESVDLVTSAINAFGLKGKEAEKVYDNIVKTTKAGKTTISGLAQGFGAVAGTVANSNIKIDEYLSSVAAMTTTGLPAAVAHTQVRAALSGLTRETKESAAIFKSLGVNSFKELVVQSGGMVNAFGLIKKQLKGNDADLLKVVGSVEAYNAIISLTGKQNEIYATTLNDMRFGKDLFDEGYNKQLETNAAQLQLFANGIQKIGISIGNSVLPPLNKGLKVVMFFMDAFDKLPQPIKSAISVIALLAGISLLAFGGILLAVSAVTKTIASFSEGLSLMIAKSPAFARSLITLARCFMSLGTAIMTTPVGWVIAAVAAIALCAIIIRKYWTPITKLFVGIGKGIKEALGPTVNEFKRFLQPLAPIIAKIKEFGAWITKIIQPVNTSGKKAESLGLSIGKLIGGFLKIVIAITKFILKIHPITGILILVIKNFDKITATVHKASEKIKSFFGIFGGKKDINLNANVNGTSVPVAKSKGKMPKFDVGSRFISETGYSVVHKGEEIAPAGTVRSLFNNNNGVTLNYNPKINFTGSATESDKSSFAQMLKKHKEDIVSIVNNEISRKARLAY